jgi:hypothetical protein
MSQVQRSFEINFAKEINLTKNLKPYERIRTTFKYPSE